MRKVEKQKEVYDRLHPYLTLGKRPFSQANLELRTDMHQNKKMHYFEDIICVQITSLKQSEEPYVYYLDRSCEE